MIPELLIIEGFQSYRSRTEVRFTEGVNGILGSVKGQDPVDSNGSGKSALAPNAITWILWGQVPSGERASDLMHWEADRVWGHLTLRGRGGHLQITRSKTRKGSEVVDFTWNGQEFKLDLKPAQEKLAEIYGISWDIYCNAIVVDANSKASQFVTATPGQRMKLLAEMIPYDDLFQTAGANVQKDITRIDSNLKMQKGILERMAGELGRAQAGLARIMESLTGESFRLQQEKQHRARKVEELNQQLVFHKSRLLEPEPPDIATLQVKKNAALQRQQAAAVQAGRAQAIIQTETPSAGTVCPTCRQEVTGAVALHLIGEKQQAERILQAAREDSARALAEVADLDKQVQSALAAIQARRTSVAEVQRIQEDLRVLQMQEESSTLAALNREKEIQDGMISALRVDIEAKEKDIGKMEEQLPILRKLAKGFQQDLRNMLLDDVRSILAYYADKYRWLIFGDAMTVEFPPTTTTGREKFEIIFRTGEHENKLPSKGQKYRMALAIILALRRVLIYGNRTPFDFLVMDDPVGELDDTGLQHLYKLMSSIREEIPCVITTAPRMLPGVSFDNTLKVDYCNRESRIMEVC
jgi:DNA repair exonuclease SbcCD ATPase subunit